uniref:platelet-activating factor receptor-like n=1 Tax=Gasterosteus aculeatus aculeatus TaxID=481459 RepID=UPI001A98CD77|nr:platelet-activating factor receptor-like [Gasterosteus aculeatus aculeatus]
MPMSCRRAVITLLPKKGNLQDIGLFGELEKKRSPCCRAKLDVSSSVTPGLTGALRKTKTLCLQQLVDAVGPTLSDAPALGSLLGLHSVRVAGRLLELWSQRLTGKEKSLLMEYSQKRMIPDPADPFPEIYLKATCKQISTHLHIYTISTPICINSLTIGDLLFVTALPFWIDYYRRDGNWIYSDVMCRLSGTLFFINTYSSVLFLCAISVSRYWAVTRPLDVATSDHRTRGIILSVLIWLFTLATAILFLIQPGTHTDDNNVTRCFEGYQNTPVSTKVQVFAFHLTIVIGFFLVFFVVVVCNFLIARTLLSKGPPRAEMQSATVTSGKSQRTVSFSSRKRRGVKQRALQMLFSVVGVFVLCFLPHHACQCFWTLAVLHIEEGFGHVDWSQKTRQALNDAHQITWLLMSLNCILDPVVYFFATQKFKGFIMAHIKKIARGGSCSTTLTSEGSMHSQRHQSEH